MKFQCTPEKFFSRTAIFVIMLLSMLCWLHQRSLIYLWSIWAMLVRKHWFLFFFSPAKKSKQEKNTLDIKLIKLHMFLVSISPLKVIFFLRTKQSALKICHFFLSGKSRCFIPNHWSHWTFLQLFPCAAEKISDMIRFLPSKRLGNNP